MKLSAVWSSPRRTRSCADVVECVLILCSSGKSRLGSRERGVGGRDDVWTTRRVGWKDWLGFSVDGAGGGWWCDVCGIGWGFGDGVVGYEML